MTAVDTFARARKVADAVLYEGYVLYPYRASSRKNQVRWQFGVVAPRVFAVARRQGHAAGDEYRGEVGRAGESHQHRRQPRVAGRHPDNSGARWQGTDQASKDQRGIVAKRKAVEHPRCSLGTAIARIRTIRGKRNRF